LDDDLVERDAHVSNLKDLEPQPQPQVGKFELGESELLVVVLVV
jgi:hypothetical protein